MLNEGEYEFTDDPVIPGKSIIVSKVGMMWLYMGDDHRRNPPQQIIAKRVGMNPELAFLDIESKRSIKLTDNYVKSNQTKA